MTKRSNEFAALQRRRSNLIFCFRIKRDDFLSKQFQIEVQKLSWNAEPKIDARNENYVEHNTRTLKKTVRFSFRVEIDFFHFGLKIFDQQPVWNAEPKIDSHNEQAINEILRAPKTPVSRIESISI